MGGNFTTNYEKCIENKQTYALKKALLINLPNDLQFK